MFNVPLFGQRYVGLCWAGDGRLAASGHAGAAGAEGAPCLDLLTPYGELLQSVTAGPDGDPLFQSVAFISIAYYLRI